MKIVQINVTSGSGSTGKICESISKLLTNRNVENYILYSSGASDLPVSIKYMSDFDVKLQALKSRVFGNYGFNSKHATYRLIHHLEKIDPDIVHLHNLHGHNCDLRVLFSWLKDHSKRIIWTFHDCWAFTAYCPHFSMIECNQWKVGCVQCPQIRQFSWFFDRSKKLFAAKKDVMWELNLTIVTPSEWLAGSVKQSFLKDYPVKVINNGIDLSVFKPTPSNFREKYGIPKDKFIVLGVAFGWGKRKGLDVFIELSKRLEQDKFQIVLVGTDEKVDKQLPKSIISIHRTQNQTELAEIYTAADLFVNPTREDNYPTVNMEAIACGTPVVTFDAGGSPECIDETCGCVVSCDDIEGLVSKISKVYKGRPYSIEACLNRAKLFDSNSKFEKCVDLYMNLKSD